MHLLDLRCSECDHAHPTDVWQSLCTACHAPLSARYDLEAAGAALRDGAHRRRPKGMWRWRELLPLPAGEEPVTLGEGDTPLLEAPRLAADLGVARLTVKDEALNPTGSFKARGMSAAVTMARHLGATTLCAPSAGNAGGALAAYGARAGIPVVLALPTDVPRSHRLEGEVHGATVHFVEGTIADCGRFLAGKRARDEDGAGAWTDLSTLKEPWRLEGKKTMGLELAEQLGGELPDAILYPTGGGTGLLGLAKAFDEMRTIGLLPADRPLPRLYAIQAAGCAPIVNALVAREDEARVPDAPHTVASGLRVPTPVAHRWILRAVRESGGGGLAIEDGELVEGSDRIARREGIFSAPEGGALVAALARLLASGAIERSEHVLLLSTGTGLKYGECWEPGHPLCPPEEGRR